MKKAIVFVHGLGGNKKTWGNFPALINSDQDLEYESFFYEYPSFIIRMPLFQKKYSSIQTLSNGLNTFLNELRDYNEIILVGHSLGGVIIKQFLVDQALSKSFYNIKKILFYAVPNIGSNFAKISNLLSWNHLHLKQLCKNTEYLTTLNDNFHKAEIEDKYTFKICVANQDEMVSEESAKLNFKYESLDFINYVDHRSIVKPQSEDSTSYKILKSFLIKPISISKYRMTGTLNFHNLYEDNQKQPFHADKKRNDLIEFIKNNALEIKKCIRILGLSGLGKTRLVVESLNLLTDEEKKQILYMDVSSEPNILSEINEWVSNGYSGLFIADNCTVRSHDKLQRVVERVDSKISLITIDSDLQKNAESDFIKLEKLDDIQIRNILKDEYGEIKDLERIVEFAQGFPKMAVLIAQARLANESDVGRLNNDDLANKLLWADNTKYDSNKEMILCSSSLFDRFGLDDEVSNEYQYIAENLTSISSHDYYSCIKEYESRGLIDRRGRYAQLVPKPLAIRLAAKWWELTPPETHQKLIETLPDTLIVPFCLQIEKMDFLEEVKKLTCSLCGEKGPFGQAEVVLTSNGSRYFRAFVNIDPELTAKTLFKIMTSLENNEINKIEGSTRRNLVYSLEKLLYHNLIFEEAVTCLFLLALNENETWSNNATGQLGQVFNILLSGTSSSLEKKISILYKLRDNNPSEETNILLLKSVDNVFSLTGNTRTVGAEYQGSKKPLEEYEPTREEVFLYWDKIIEFILYLSNNGEKEKELSLNILGYSLRTLCQFNRINSIELIITSITSRFGIHWPVALETINNTIEFDSSEISKDCLEKLNQWKKLFIPDTLDIKNSLNVIIIDPPYEHKKEGDSYKDISYENAKELALSYEKITEKIYPFIQYLLIGEQRQSLVFGRFLITRENYDSLLDKTFEEVDKITSPNINFLIGLFTGLNNISNEKWEDNILKVYEDPRLVKYYPNLILTAELKSDKLNRLITLLTEERISVESLQILKYGSVTSTLQITEITSFCEKLSLYSKESAWIALDILYMYTISKNGLFNEVKESFKDLCLNVSLEYKSDAKEGSLRSLEIDSWSKTLSRLIKEEDVIFSKKVMHKLVSLDTGYTLNYNLKKNIKKLIYQMCMIFPYEIWTIFGKAILSSKSSKKYFLTNIIKGKRGSSNEVGLLNLIPIEIVINWCNEYGEKAQLLVAENLLFIEEQNKEQKVSQLFIQMLIDYGDNPLVKKYLYQGTHISNWSGSLVPYLEKDYNTISELLNHENPNVQEWSSKFLEFLKDQINSESKIDEEDFIY